MIVFIFGSSGNMGKALVYAFKKLGHKTYGVDIDKDENKDYLKCDCSDINQIEKVLDSGKPSLVFSALPYYLNKNLGQLCVKKQIPYADLGGHVETSQAINEIAREKKSMVFTDLGLAPGWINIEAERGYKELGDKADKVEMYVGGIPLNPEEGGPLKYKLTWSIEGLLNEYTDDCLVVNDGKIRYVPGMSHTKTIKILDSELEAFPTSGGLAHSTNSMINKNVKDCAYYTVRWPGHSRIMKWLLHSKLSLNDLKELIHAYSKDVSECIVIMKCVVKKDSLRWEFNNIIIDDKNFTSMQKATAFAAASAICSIPKNQNSRPQIYSDVCYKQFKKSMNLLGRLFV